jgi:hypothetical protein
MTLEGTTKDKSYAADAISSNTVSYSIKYTVFAKIISQFQFNSILFISLFYFINLCIYLFFYFIYVVYMCDSYMAEPGRVFF